MNMTEPRKSSPSSSTPHAEAQAALYLWGNEFGRFPGDWRDFWHGLSEHRKEAARAMARKIREAPREIP